MTGLWTGILSADFDGDGDMDLVAANLGQNTPYAASTDQPDTLFAGDLDENGDMEYDAYHGGVSYWLRGQGDGSFVSVPVNASGLSVPSDGRGVAVADYDQDGWIDIAVGVNNQRPLLFHNRGVADNHSINVQLKGDTTSPDGISARITVAKPDGTTTMREIQAGSDYLSQDSITQVFGLGSATEATVTVRWSNGDVTAQDVTAGEHVVIAQ